MRLLRNVLVAMFAVLLAVVAGFTALNWAPDRSVASLAATWAQPPSSFIALEGMNVHIRDEGPRDDPMPLVLIHGTSSNLHTWDGWAAILSTSHRVVRMDLPGFGLTGPAPDADYSTIRYSRFILALMDRLGFKRAVLAGNSLGGGIAWFTAVTAPERVAKLILIDSAGYPMQATSVPLGFRLARLPVLNRLADYILPRSVIESSVRNVYGDPARVTPALVSEYVDMTLRAGNRRALAQRLAQAKWEDFSDRIPTVHQPTLILWGALDRLIPPVNAARFHSAIQGSKLVMLDGLGHVPQEEDPAGSVAPAVAFLSRP